VDKRLNIEDEAMCCAGETEGLPVQSDAIFSLNDVRYVGRLH